MFSASVLRKAITGLALATSLGAATLASIEPAEARGHHVGHHGGFHHGGGFHRGGFHHGGFHHGGFRHGGFHYGVRRGGFRHGGYGWHHGWGRPGFAHRGWGYRAVGLRHAFRPCLRRVLGPHGWHLARVC